MIRGDKTYRIVTNQLGSPMAVVDVATGDVVQELDYDEFGRVTRDTNPEFQPFGFAGGLWDRETGLVRFGARDYDPETGRFTAPDPAGFAGGSTNLYGYALNDPVNITDPSGQVLDTILDLGFIAYDLYRIGKSLMNGCGVSPIDAAALGARHRRGLHPVRHRRRCRGPASQRGHLPDRHAGRALHRPVQQHRPAHDRACPGPALHPGATRRRVPHGGDWAARPSARSPNSERSTMPPTASARPRRRCSIR